MDARSILSPGGIIRAFLKLTEACRPFVTDEDRDHLWIGLQNPRRGEPFKRLWRGRDVDREVKRFAARNKLMGDDGQPLALRLARLRPTWLTKRYKAGGNLAAVSRDANHAQAETTIAYINNTETQTIHEQTVAEGLNDFYRGVRERILTQCPDDPQQVANVARLVEATLEQAEAMLRGEQDTFISTCRDFYNRPGGPDNTPCDKPWSCFTCKNAYWTSRSLPGVIRFLDFMIDQRSLLAEGDWRAKFGIPYAVITDFILPAFPAESVDEARLTAEAEQFIVPITLKTI